MSRRLLRVDEVNPEDLTDESFYCEDCEEISPLVAEYLASRCRWIKLDGLKTISIEVAKALAGVEHLGLRGVEQMDLATATMLSRCGRLDLSGLTSISPEVADALLNVATITFNGLSELDEALVQVLARHRGELNLYGIKSIPPPLVHELSKHDGPVHLGIEELNEEVAEWLVASHRDFLGLSTVTSITDEAAEILGRFDGDVTLYALPSLSPTQAHCMAHLAGDLGLPAMKSINAEVAAALSQCRGLLILDGLESLDSSAARELAKTQGDLEIKLDGENVEIAREFASFQNDLGIEAPRCTAEFVQALVGKQALLLLREIKSLSIEVAEALVHFENYLVLCSLSRLDDATAQVLARFHGKGLSLPNFDYRSLKSIRSLIQLLENPRIDFPKEAVISWLGSNFSLAELTPFEVFLRNEFLCHTERLERIAAAEILIRLDPSQADEYLDFFDTVTSFAMILFDVPENELLRTIQALEKIGMKASASLASLERLSHHENKTIAIAAQEAIQSIRLDD